MLIYASIGRTNQTSVAQMTTFFQNQTFGDNFYKRQGPAGIPVFGPIVTAVRGAHPIPPGANDANGNYVIDTPPFTDFTCDGYYSLATDQLAYTLNNVTGILKQNVDLMLELMFINFNENAGCQVKGYPTGVPGS
jgi:hypothetical protein